MSKQNPNAPDIHASEHIPGGNDKLTGFLVLIVKDETSAVPVANVVTEQTLKTITLPINSYTSILIEAIAQFNMNRSAAAKNVAYWYIKSGAATQKGFMSRYVNTTGPATITGPSMPLKIDTVIAGGQVGATSITITGAMMIANANDSITVHSVRLWGIV
jgi:hypothetical protein